MAGEEPVCDKRQLKRMLRENHERGGYVEDISKIKVINGSRVRTTIINIKKAIQYLGLDFYMNENYNNTNSDRDVFDLVGRLRKVEPEDGIKEVNGYRN